MHLDELRPEVDAHGGLVDANTNPLVQVERRHRVESPSHLNVVIGVHFGVIDPARHVEWFRGRREHFCLFHGLEQLARHLARRAVHTLTGNLSTPVLGVLSGIVQVDECLSVGPAFAYVRHLILHARLVLGRANTRWIDEDAARLGVVDECGDERWIERVGVLDDRLHVIRNEYADHGSKKAPGALESLAHRFGGLQERWPHKLIAAERQRYDEHPEHAQATPRGLANEPHLAQINLRLLTSRRIVDSHRRLFLAPAKLLHREAAHSVAARIEPVVAHE
jgi:hypothetical protein